MKSYSDILFQLPAHECPQLESIFKLHRDLAVIPKGFDQEAFVSSLAPDARAAQDQFPDEERLLLLEYTASTYKHQRRQLDIKPGPPPHVQGTMITFAPDGARTQQLLEEINRCFESECKLQGDFYYPPSGFRSWHSNTYDRPGWRMYVVTASVANESAFRVFDKAEQRFIDFPDDQQCVYFFKIYPGCLLWHSIISFGAHRWSSGFAIPPNWKSRLGIE